MRRAVLGRLSLAVATSMARVRQASSIQLSGTLEQQQQQHFGINHPPQANGLQCTNTTGTAPSGATHTGWWDLHSAVDACCARRRKQTYYQTGRASAIIECSSHHSVRAEVLASKQGGASSPFIGRTAPSMERSMAVLADRVACYVAAALHLPPDAYPPSWPMPAASRGLKFWAVEWFIQTY